MSRGCVVLLFFTVLLVEVFDVIADETCHCRNEHGKEYMKHCRRCCGGDRRNQHCCEDEGLTVGQIVGIAVGSVAVFGIAVTICVCIYKKKCNTASKTGPSHLVGPVVSLESGTAKEMEKKQPLPQDDYDHGTPKRQTGPLPLAEVPISAPPAYQVLPEPYVPGQIDGRDEMMSPPPPYSTPLP